jgi:hypothetical protein
MSGKTSTHYLYNILLLWIFSLSLREKSLIYYTFCQIESSCTLLHMRSPTPNTLINYFPSGFLNTPTNAHQKLWALGFSRTPAENQCLKAQ